MKTSFDNKLFYSLVEINSPSGKEEKIMAFLEKFCKKEGAKVYYDDKGNMYVTKGKEGTTKPCVLAHVDTVFKGKRKIKAVEIENTIIGFDINTMAQAGLGADDKVGVLIGLEALRRCDNIKLLFTVEEEIGCLGAKEVDLSFFDDVSFVAQCDRAGYGKIVASASNFTYDDVEVTSEDFREEMGELLKKYGLSFTHTGGSSDFLALKIKGLDICAVNIECGYYKQHKDEEYVDVLEASLTQNLVLDMISSMGDTKWEHKSKLSQKSYSSYWDDDYGYKTTTKFYSLQKTIDSFYKNQTELVHKNNIKIK